jgi:hypothetical protein
MVGIIATCVTSSAIEMHAVGLKTGTESGSALSASSATRGTMTIMALTMTNLTGSAPQREGTMQEVSRLILET